jgi:CRISPR-associated protein Cst1
MELTQLEKLKQVGDLIAKCIQKSGGDKRLKQLERAKNYGECRNILRFVIRERIQQGASEPLFSLDDYMEHLFPASDNLNLTPWRETRDLLLFRIYETLHDWLQEQDFVDYDDDNTSETDDNNEEDN